MVGNTRTVLLCKHGKFLKSEVFYIVVITTITTYSTFSSPKDILSFQGVVVPKMFELFKFISKPVIVLRSFNTIGISVLEITLSFYVYLVP